MPRLYLNTIVKINTKAYLILMIIIYLYKPFYEVTIKIWVSVLECDKLQNCLFKQHCRRFIESLGNFRSNFFATFDVDLTRIRSAL